VHVVFAPGARLVVPHDAAPTVPEPLNDVWAIATPVIVFDPVFVTVYVYVTVSPGFKPAVGVLVTVKPKVFVVSGVNVADACGDVTAPFCGFCPEAVPVTVTVLPASIWAWVTV